MVNKSFLLDLNLFAISIAENHPGYQFINTLMNEAEEGKWDLWISEYAIFRVHWILTSKWKLDKLEAHKILSDFITRNQKIRIIGLQKLGIHDAFSIAKSNKFNLYDCYLLALARQEKLTGILTSDTDFDKMCPKLGLKYWNPVPNSILKDFKKIQE